MSEVTRFIPTGSTLLDCALGGGGWAVGRLSTLAGMQSTGKTGLAIEAVANFAALYPKGKILWFDAEAALDESYAEQIGMALDRVEFNDSCTIETWSAAIEAFIAEQPEGVPGLIVTDSMDALSTDKEIDTTLAELGGYGADKAKSIGILLRKTSKKLEAAGIHNMLIQQLRDNFASTHGGKKASGGRAIHYYASQEVTLKNVKHLTRTIDGIARDYGVDMVFKIDKCRTGTPFREVEVKYLFGYGIDDVGSNLAFLRKTGHLLDLPKAFVITVDPKTKKEKLLESDRDIVARIEAGDITDATVAKNIKANRKIVADLTRKVWNLIEDQHKIVRLPKY